MAEAVGSLPELVEKILDHLPIRELNRVALVNTTWDAVAQRIKCKRNQICWTCWSTAESFKVDVNNYLNNILSEPDLALMFLSDKLWGSKRKSQNKGSIRAKKNKRLILHKSLIAGLPRGCHTIQIASDKVIAINPPCTFCDRGKAEACLSLWPQRKDLTIKTATSFGTSSSTSCNDLFELMNLSGSDNSVSGIEGKTPKLLLLFLVSNNRLKNTIITKQCPVAGLTVDSLYYGGCKCAELALVFYGSSSVQAATMVIPDFCNTEAEIKERLNDFLPFLRSKFEGEHSDVLEPQPEDVWGPPVAKKQKCDFDVRKYSERITAFAFTCVERNASFFDHKRDVEGRAFTSVLPGVPLLGLFGYGEIGINAPNPKDFDKFFETSDGLSLSDCMLYYSTVFALVVT